MKSLFTILFTCALAFTLTACDNKKSNSDPTVSGALAEARAAGVEIYTEKIHGGQTVITYMALYDVPQTYQGLRRADLALERLKLALRNEVRSDYIEQESVSYINLAQSDLNRCVNRLESGYNRCYFLGNIG